MKIDTKANTLKKLSTKIKYSIIPKSYIFTVNEWQNKNIFLGSYDYDYDLTFSKT